MLFLDDEDDDVDEADGKQVENTYDFPPQLMSKVEQLDSERYGTDQAFHSNIKP